MTNDDINMQMISLVTDRNWSEIAERGDLNNWREILSSLVTFAKPEEFTKLCGKESVCVCVTLYV